MHDSGIGGSRGPTLGRDLRRARIDRFFAGLEATSLLEDLQVGGPYTLLAPLDAAYDALPWSFDALLRDPALVEARFDLFEYAVVRGVLGRDDDGDPRPTLHGGPVCVRVGYVLGLTGVARIVATRPFARGVVHVVDRVLAPADPRGYDVDAPLAWELAVDRGA